MQGGMKACPQCATVNDSSSPTCKSCGHDFTVATSSADERPRILADGEVPRVIADDSNIIRRRSGLGGKVTGIAVFIVVATIFGSVGLFLFGIRDTIEEATEPFKIDIPGGDQIEIPTDVGNDDGRTFTRASCTSEVSRALKQLLQRQADNKSMTELFTKFTSFGVGSFEYQTLLRLYGDFETQSELTTGSESKAIRIAKRNVAAACREHYAAND